MRSGAYHITRLTDAITGLVAQVLSDWPVQTMRREILALLMDCQRHGITRLRESTRSGRILGMVMLDELFSARSTLPG